MKDDMRIEAKLDAIITSLNNCSPSQDLSFIKDEIELCVKMIENAGKGAIDRFISKIVLIQKKIDGLIAQIEKGKSEVSDGIMRLNNADRGFSAYKDYSSFSGD